MSKEKERLRNMLKENKISLADYELLVTALDKKSVLLGIETSFFINPFQRIAGWKALWIGLVLMLIMSIIGIYANIYFDGILGSTFAIGIKARFKPGFYLLLYQNIVNWLTLSILFLLGTIVFRQKRIRIIDFFGTVALSRYPYLVLIIFTAILYIVYPGYFNIDTSKGYELHLSALNAFLNFFWTLCYLWQLLTYFFALKEASGLNGKRLWICFIMAMLIAEPLSTILSRMFLYT